MAPDKLPKFGDDSYQDYERLVAGPHVRGDADLHRSTGDMVWMKADLPRRYDRTHRNVSARKPGSAGKDTSGMLRQHQFEKVEMVSVTHPDNSRR